MAIHGCKNSSVLYISRYQAYSGIYSAKIFDGLVARLKSHEDVENVEIDLLATHQLSSKEEAMARPLAKYKAPQANFCGLRHARDYGGTPDGIRCTPSNRGHQMWLRHKNLPFIGTKADK